MSLALYATTDSSCVATKSRSFLVCRVVSSVGRADCNVTALIGQRRVLSTARPRNKTQCILPGWILIPFFQVAAQLILELHNISWPHI